MWCVPACRMFETAKNGHLAPRHQSLMALGSCRVFAMYTSGAYYRKWKTRSMPPQRCAQAVFQGSFQRESGHGGRGTGEQGNRRGRRPGGRLCGLAPGETRTLSAHTSVPKRTPSTAKHPTRMPPVPRGTGAHINYFSVLLRTTAVPPSTAGP